MDFEKETQRRATLIQKNKWEKKWEHNLVVHNLKPEQLLINALVIPKGLLSLAVIVALYLVLPLPLCFNISNLFQDKNEITMDFSAILYSLCL